MAWRNESASKAPKRETRFLPALMSIHTHVWRAVFGKSADAIEKSVENADECTPLSYVFSGLQLTPTRTVDMIIDNDPPITRNISVPRDMSSLSCSSFTAGIVEAVLDGLGFVRFRIFILSATQTHLPYSLRVSRRTTLQRTSTRIEPPFSSNWRSLFSSARRL